MTNFRIPAPKPKQESLAPKKNNSKAAKRKALIERTHKGTRPIRDLQNSK